MNYLKSEINFTFQIFRVSLLAANPLSMEDLIYSPTQAQVARALISSGSYIVKDEASLLNRAGWFKWKSGIEAPVYTNCRYLMGQPGARAVVEQALVSSIKHNFPGAELIIGLEASGIRWSSAVADDMGLPDGFVRKNLKGHGSDPGLYVGSPSSLKNITAVIVDDLVASGESIEKAIEAIREEKQITIVGVQSIVNWNFNHMKERFRRLNIPIKALVSYPQLLNEVVNQGIIDTEIMDEFLFFYQNPKGHQFNFSFLANRILKTGTTD